MLYLFSIDDTSTTTLTFSVDEADTLFLGSSPLNTCQYYKNFGKLVTVYREGVKGFLLKKGIEYAADNLLYEYKNRPQCPSFFSGLEDITKPDQYRMKYARVGEDLLIFFSDSSTLDLFLHDKIFASQFFFNDKNDQFNCSIFQTRSEVFLTEGINTLIMDVYGFSYSKVICEGATIEQQIDEGKHVITVTLPTDAYPLVPPQVIISQDTDTYKLVFPEKGEYLIRVQNDNFYPVKTFTKVIVC